MRKRKSIIVIMIITIIVQIISGFEKYLNLTYNDICVTNNNNSAVNA